MLEKIKHTDFRWLAVILGTIGFFLILGSAGASDTGVKTAEFLPYLLTGIIMMILSYKYIAWYEHKLN